MQMQTEFANGLLDADKPVPKGLIQPDGSPAHKRYDVYRNNVVMSLISALSDGFPICKMIVGETFFDAVAGLFVRAHPPKSPLMIYYGKDFPRFLDSFPPAKQVPYLADMARLEWARRIAFHAADDVPTHLSELETLEETQLLATRFAFIAATAVTSSKHPIFDIYRFNTGDLSEPPKPTAQSVLVTRPAGQVTMHLLPAGADIMVNALLGGDTLGNALAKAQSDDAFDASASLASLFGAQTIKNVLR